MDELVEILAQDTPQPTWTAILEELHPWEW